MINVLHVVKAYRGNYPLLNNLTNLDRTRFNTHVCYLTGTDDGKNLIGQNGTQAHYLHFEGTLHAYSIGIARQIALLVDSIDIDCVISHLEKAIHPTALSRLFTSAHPTHIGVIHGMVGGNSLPRKKKLLNWLAFKAMDKIVSVSQSRVADILEQNWALPSNKVIAIQNGIDAESIVAKVDHPHCKDLLPPPMRNYFIFGTVGRLAAVKNQLILLQALSVVLKHNTRVGLVLVGSGPLKVELESKAQELNIIDNVWFAEYRHDVPALLAAMDAFLFPSLREGLPLSLLEAMAMNKPCIASNIASVREIICTDTMGHLLPPDEIACWAERMLEMSHQSADALRLIGQCAHDRVFEHFTHTRMIHDYEQLISQLCDQQHAVCTGGSRIQ
jgi:glycosyltransferase involved in cell wall biosynthesis